VDLGATRLILNADDLGLTPSCTEAILEAFQRGYISSATMVANGPCIAEAARRCREAGLQDRLGIHLNLTEGTPLTTPILGNARFVDEQGLLHGRIDRLKPLARLDREHVAAELAAQIERIRDLGIPLTHADSHHHIHTGLFIAPVVLKVLAEHHMTKVRIHRNLGRISGPKRLVKSLFNAYLAGKGFQLVERFGSFEDVLTSGNRPGPRLLEVMVHPDYDAQGNLIDRVAPGPGRPLREVWESLMAARLCSYGDLLARA
jgi:predicted glycoside hydrolase/deacetylase ChbG (UPF0249 family)